MGILAQIYLSANSSEYKRNLAKNLGAEIIITNTRQEAEDQAVASINKETYFLHPSNNPLMVAGIGTACFEALQELKSCDAIFASCGGGGLLAGTYLASKALSPGSKIYAAEPLQANDAALSYQSGKIVRFQESPITIADGARTLGVAEEIFGYLKQLNGFYLISEDEIKYWTRWISHLLEIKCEPTSALAMAAACKWLKEQQKVSEVLVIISGGNIDPEAHDEIWGNNYLEKLPNNV
jgi:threonine dehydratase